MKKPRSLRFSLVSLAIIFPLFLSLMFWYDVRFEGEWPSTLTDRSIFLAGVVIVMIMSGTRPEDMRSRREWQQFVWALPLICITQGVAGYAIMWWLYGNGVKPTVEIVAWSVLAVCTLIGLLIAWYRDKSYEWPEAEKR